MNLHEIPFAAIVSMPQCFERRMRVQNALAWHGLNQVICVHPIPLSEIDPHDYPHFPPKVYPYISQIITLKMVIAEAKRRGVPSVWILEDDATFHPDFYYRTRLLKVPNNWRFLYLGGAYYTNAVRVNEGLVRPDRILDLHSVVISSAMYDIIIERFNRALRERHRTEIFADMLLADLHLQFPAYLCRPNLVWQSTHHSDLNGRIYSSYKKDGEQWHCPTQLPPNAVFTFWSRARGALSAWLDRETLIQSFLRAAYLAHQRFFRVVLYTDSFGAELLRGVPFDEVHVTLDALEVDPAFRCAAKLDTFTRQTDAFLHLEPDIFFQKPMTMPAPEVIVTQGKEDLMDADLAAAELSKLSWVPDFARELLADSSEVEFGSCAVLGGADSEFFRWYGRTGLEILRRDENIGVLESGVDDGMAVSDALEHWLLGACARHRGKRFRYVAEKPEMFRPVRKHRNATRAPFFQAKETEKRSAEFKEKLAVQNVRDRLKNASNVADIRYAKAGDGWYIDLQKVDFRAIRTSAIGGGEPEIEGITSRLGVKYGWHLLSSTSERMKRSKGAPPSRESLRQALLELLDAARRQNAEHALLLDSKVKFHTHFHHMVHRIRVPYDWQFIYLGGRSEGEEEFVSRGVIKSDRVFGLHAVMIRTEAFSEVRRVLEAPLSKSESAETRIAQLHENLPTYLCWPQPVLPMVHTGRK